MKTSQNNSNRISSHPLIVVGLVTGLLALAACQPVRDPAVVAAEQTAVASGTTAPEATVPAAEEAPEVAEISGVEPAQATISTSSLRVRALPSEDAEVVASVSEGDTFTVTGISTDGEWIQVSVEESPSGLGWVSAEFVTLAGDITNIAVIDGEAAATEEATAEATEEATPEATEEATEEATAEATEEATPEATEEATEEATVEATEEATPEATEEATEEATAEATEEATPEATEEATPEATEEATPEATEEATEEPTEEPTVEATAVVTEEATVEATPAITATEVVTAEATPEVTATPEATEEASTPTPELGTVTIVVDLPLRVRSEPTADVDNKIGSVYNDEVYTVLEVSEDGLWVRLETPQFPEGSGWVSAEFVVYNEAE